jgi:hypothetical protein
MIGTTKSEEKVNIEMGGCCYNFGSRSATHISIAK